jgi:hypothetical protein
MVIVCALTVTVFGALLTTLIVGDSSIAVNAEKVNVRGKVRSAIDWVTRDLRGAISWEINANSPSTNYVKFNLWSWDAVNNTWQLGSRFVEYAYDPSLHTLTRRLVDSSGNVLERTDFPEIMLSPFYTAYTDEFTNQFDPNALLANRRLFVVIRSTHRVRNSRDVSCTLVEEVKIRNG